MRYVSQRRSCVLRVALVACLVPNIAFGLGAESSSAPLEEPSATAEERAAELPMFVPPCFEDPDVEDSTASVAPHDAKPGIASKRFRLGRKSGGRKIGRHFGGKGRAKLGRKHGNGHKKGRKKFGL